MSYDSEGRTTGCSFRLDFFLKLNFAVLFACTNREDVLDKDTFDTVLVDSDIEPYIGTEALPACCSQNKSAFSVDI